MRWCTSCCGLFALCCASQSGVEAPAPRAAVEQRDLGERIAPAPPLESPATGLVVGVPEGPKPWTHLDARTGDGHFQFAIVSDNTGGSRPGVFASALHKLNLLEPEFVMSVGDLIEGYTEDRAELRRQWEAFDAMVSELDAPFFYVPGNHDITNPTMREIWHERYGPSHYHFRYEGVLFVCLDSMDGEMHQIAQPQITWLERVLDANRDVSWTLLFLHSPLWDDGPSVSMASEDELNWQRVELALEDRPYTVFAGHHHRYIKHVRNDRKHFTLATTGGHSSLRGSKFGEFDHVTWVSMRPGGPLVANLMLSGIEGEDVRTEALRALEHGLREGDAFKPTPIFFEGAFTQGSSSVRLRNRYDRPLQAALSASIPDGFDVVLAGGGSVMVPANSELDVPIEVSARAPFRADHARIPLLLTATVEGPAGPVSFEASSTIGVVRRLTSTLAKRAPIVDGDLAEWGKLRFDVNRAEQVRTGAEAWKGSNDSRLSFGVQHDERYVYLAVRVQDDTLMVATDVPPWKQDGVEIRFDARPEPKRSHAVGARDGREVLVLALSPSSGAEASSLHRAAEWSIPDGVQAVSVKRAGGYTAELAVPREWLVASGSADVVRINVAVSDLDADGQSQSSWWPAWSDARGVPGVGTFELR